MRPHAAPRAFHGDGGGHSFPYRVSASRHYRGRGCPHPARTVRHPLYAPGYASAPDAAGAAGAHPRPSAHVTEDTGPYGAAGPYGIRRSALAGVHGR